MRSMPEPPGVSVAAMPTATGVFFHSIGAFMATVGGVRSLRTVTLRMSERFPAKSRAWAKTVVSPSALMVTFYFGGYTLYPILTPETAPKIMGSLLGLTSPNWINLWGALLLHLVFMAKILFFLWIFIHVRWTLPRFRYDQLMDLGWRTMLPWALANTVITAVIILIMRYPWGA